MNRDTIAATVKIPKKIDIVRITFDSFTYPFAFISFARNALVNVNVNDIKTTAMAYCCLNKNQTANTLAIAVTIPVIR